MNNDLLDDLFSLERELNAIYDDSEYNFDPYTQEDDFDNFYDDEYMED